jgi:hypothetical protein
MIGPSGLKVMNSGQSETLHWLDPVTDLCSGQTAIHKNFSADYADYAD